MPAAMQRAIAAMGLLVMAPVLGGIAVAVRLTSGGPILHRALRVGGGRTFTLYKFRTMVVAPGEADVGITAAGDPRITALGRRLRRTRLDELPQLWNVLRGEMLLVGPRPEDPRFVDWSDPLHARVFSAQAGMTGPTALAFRDEESLLATEASLIARASRRETPASEDLERAYRERILPRKLAMDAAYLDRRGLRTDLLILARSLGVLITRPGRT